MARDPAHTDIAWWWCPDGSFRLGHFPRDWERIRRSTMRNNQWNKLIRKYFKRRNSVRKEIGFDLPQLQSFEETVWENRRQYYLVVNPSLLEDRIYFVQHRFAGLFRNTHWREVILAGKNEIMRNHIRKAEEHHSAAQVANDKITHNLMTEIIARLDNVHMAVQCVSAVSYDLLHATLSGDRSAANAEQVAEQMQRVANSKTTLRQTIPSLDFSQLETLLTIRRMRATVPMPEAKKSEIEITEVTDPADAVIH